MIMTMAFQDVGDGELLMVIEEPETEKYPQRRALRYPNRLTACTHLTATNLLPEDVIAALMTADLEEQISFPVLIRDPKAALRGFMPYPMTGIH